MTDEGRGELTRGEDFTSFERRMMKLFDRMAARAEASEQEAERREERIQRKIEFIVQQQAQFQANTEADMQQLRETQARSEQKWERTEGGIRALLAIAEIHQQEFAELRQAQARSTAAQAQTDRQMAETDERINALVNTVERIISERRNGGGKKEESSE
jgi:hypothetical protein